MTPQEIIKDIENSLSEYLEMMSIEEKFMLIRNALAQKVAYEMSMKDYYKACFHSFYSRKGED